MISWRLTPKVKLEITNWIKPQKAAIGFGNSFSLKDERLRPSDHLIGSPKLIALFKGEVTGVGRKPK